MLLSGQVALFLLFVQAFSPKRFRLLHSSPFDYLSGPTPFNLSFFQILI